MAVTKDVTRIILRRGDNDDFTNELADSGITQYEGEPKWNTDGKTLWVYDGNENIRVHGLDNALTYEGDIIIDRGDIVWLN